MPHVPTHPPLFSPGSRLSYARWEEIRDKLNAVGFLWPTEIDIVGEILKANELGIAWDDTEKGQFSDRYFDPVKFPVIPHVPWAQKNMRIPPALRTKLIEELQRKINTGVLEPSSSSYRSRWFVVPKKDGNLRIVWNLEPLNAPSIRDSGVPPILDKIIEDFAGRSCYSLLDIYIGYDEGLVHPESRDFTTIQTPLGPLRLTTLPMGYTNAVAIFHGDVVFIFRDEIPHVAQPFIDDVGVKGPKTRYELEDGSYETLPGQPGVHRFIWEHLNDLNRILH